MPVSVSLKDHPDHEVFIEARLEKGGVTCRCSCGHDMSFETDIGSAEEMMRTLKKCLDEVTDHLHEETGFVPADTSDSLISNIGPIPDLWSEPE